MVGAFPVLLETSTHPNEGRGQGIRCLRSAELVPGVRGTPAEICAKAGTLNSTAARSSAKQLCTGCSRGNV